MQELLTASSEGNKWQILFLVRSVACERSAEIRCRTSPSWQYVVQAHRSFLDSVLPQLFLLTELYFLHTQSYVRLVNSRTFWVHSTGVFLWHYTFTLGILVVCTSAVLSSGHTIFYEHSMAWLCEINKRYLLVRSAFVIRTYVVAMNLTKLSLDANVISDIPCNIRTS
jgi:hypothetical protein